MSNKVFAMVAGEASGDILGAGLIKELKKKHPDAFFYGIGGPLMLAEGMQSIYPMERLSVMGLVEVLGRLGELLKVRKKLLELFSKDQPDVFIGIDAPDFNLPLARKLKLNGIKTVHYVSPSVWAWRQGRVKKIAKSIDLMLALFPFEADFYKQHQIKVAYVGHTLADQVEMEPSKDKAISALDLDANTQYLSILPGSRSSEVERILPLFLSALTLIHQQNPALQFLIPAVNGERYEQIYNLWKEHHPELKVHLFHGQSRLVMQASDAVLLASGTAALEAMLLKKPMVVSYVVSKITWFIASRMLKSKWVALPNILANRELVPEILQHNATPEALSQAILAKLENSEDNHHIHETYCFIHARLRRHADAQASQAVLELIDAAR